MRLTGNSVSVVDVQRRQNVATVGNDSMGPRARRASPKTSDEAGIIAGVTRPADPPILWQKGRLSLAQQQSTAGSSEDLKKMILPQDRQRETVNLRN